jgi:hypothetical protein
VREFGALIAEALAVIGRPALKTGQAMTFASFRKPVAELKNRSAAFGLSPA